MLFTLMGESSGGGTNLSATDNKVNKLLRLLMIKNLLIIVLNSQTMRKLIKKSLSRNLQNRSEKASINYKPSDSELRTFADAYIKANAKRAKVDYKVKTYLPDYVLFMLDQKQSTWITWMFMNWAVNFTKKTKVNIATNSEAMKAGEKYIFRKCTESIWFNSSRH